MYTSSKQSLTGFQGAQMGMHCKTRTVFLLVFLLIAGCKTTQQKAEAVSLNNNPPPQETQKVLASNAQSYLQRANTQGPNRSVEYKLMAADLLIQSKSLEQANHLLNSIPQESLKPEYASRQALLLGHIELFKKQPNKALNHIAKIDPTTLKRDDLTKYYLLQAETFEDLANLLDAARARMNLGHYLAEQNNVQKNQYEIARLLSKVPLSELQQASMRGNPLERGWYDLSLLKQRFGQNRHQYQQAMQDWLMTYPQHPARMTIPEHLIAAPQSIEINQPKNIALLLPLSGSHKHAAKAIQEGFLASFYESQGQKPQIRVYDTEKTEDIQSIYRQAVSEGADFVVGPLNKNAVFELSQLPTYQVKTPIIALNHHPDIKQNTPEFFQFALTPEEEAQQLAERAWQNGYRLASIVVPDNVWGKRTAQSFEKHWHFLGGTISKVSLIGTNEDQAAHIRKLLNIDASQNRANKIKKMLVEKVEFQPRRRSDVDLIVLAAPPEQARQLKPLFEFYYANDIPIYATSSIYYGKPNPKKDRDINGIVFCDMPGILDQQQSEVLNELLTKYSKSQGEQHTRLFAMGVDAYQLTQQLSQLKNDPRAQFNGVTGTLSVGPNNEIKRQLSWAKFKGGIAEKI